MPCSVKFYIFFRYLAHQKILIKYHSKDEWRDLMNIMTVVRYKLKSGFEDEFIKAINAYNYSNSIFMRLVSIGNDEYLTVMEYDEIDKTGDDEISGVDWLHSIEHMLEFFGDSRTDACSGLVLASYN